MAAAEDTRSSLPALEDLWEKPEGTGIRIGATPALWSQAQVAKPVKKKSPAFLGVIAVIVGVIGYSVYDPTSLPELEFISTPLRSLFMSDISNIRLPNLKLPSISKKEEDPELVIPMTKAQIGLETYSVLANRIVAPIRAPQERWSPDEEEFFKKAVASESYYQKYNAVQMIRQKLLLGSDGLLYELKKQPAHLWLRVYTLMGISDFGNPIDSSDITEALAGQHPDTVKNFLKRFAFRDLTHGERYIIRALLPYVDERGRYWAMRALMHTPDELSQEYLEASKTDPAPLVATWASRQTVDLAKVQASQDDINAVVEDKKHPQAVKPEDAKKLEEEEVIFYEVD